MAKNLNEYLEGRKGGGFRSVPHYFASGDFVTYYLRNDRCHARRVDDWLTVYLTVDTDELVGCKIERVKHVLRAAEEYGMPLGKGTVHLGLFLFLGAVLAKDEDQKKWYEELKHVAKDVGLDLKELQIA